MPPTAVQSDRYRFVLEYLTEDGDRIGEQSLRPTDFHRAAEAVFWDALRHGHFSAYDPPLEEAAVMPCFADSDQVALADGFTVSLPTPAGGEHQLTFGAAYFHSWAHRAAAQAIRAETLPVDGKLRYRLSAYRDELPTPRVGVGDIVVDAGAITVPLRAGSAAELGEASAWDRPGPEDFPVYVPRRVLEESIAEARLAPEREVGGVLLGHVRRDAAGNDLFLEITCQVPAEHTEATATSVTFTAATWGRVREVVDLRGEGEIVAGWVHSHPFRVCKDCPLPTPPDCIKKILFYSADDEFVMEQAFARPFMVGLLTAVEPRLEEALGHLPVRLYGWAQGQIAARGFHVFG